MPATQKAVALLDAIAEELLKRLSAITPQTKGQDSAQNPQLVVGAGTAGAAGCYLRVISQPWTAKNVLGSTSDVFSPHVVQVVFEANPAGGAGADINSLATLSTVIAVCARKNTALEIFQETNGAAPGEADCVAAKLQVRLDASLDHGMIANQ
jgi:hypothetical protein